MRLFVKGYLQILKLVIEKAKGGIHFIDEVYSHMHLGAYFPSVERHFCTIYIT